MSLMSRIIMKISCNGVTFRKSKAMVEVSHLFVPLFFEFSYHYFRCPSRIKSLIFLYHWSLSFRSMSRSNSLFSNYYHDSRSPCLLGSSGCKQLKTSRAPRQSHPLSACVARITCSNHIGLNFSADFAILREVEAFSPSPSYLRAIALAGGKGEASSGIKFNSY